MPVTHLKGVRLFHRSLGAGPDIVLTHGLGASHAFWFPAVAPALASAHRVTVHDLRGHGRSSMPASGYRVPVMAADLLGLLDGLGIARAHLVGHSFGGLVALELALRRPDRVASLVAADCRLSTPARRQANGHEPVDVRTLEQLARRSPAAERARVKGAFAPFGGWGGGERSRRRWLELVERTEALRELQSARPFGDRRLRALEPPVLAVYGAQSFALPSGRRLARLAPRCRLVVIPRAGHFCPAVAPGAFVAAVTRFVEEEAAEWPHPAKA